MSRRDAKVTLPVAGGLDQSVDEWVLNPPKAEETENLRIDKSGALRTRPGFSSIGALSDISGKVVVPGDTSALVLGDSPAKVVSASGTFQSAAAGAPFPAEVLLHRLKAGRGFVRDVQCATNGGYTCLAYSVLSDTNELAASNDHIILDYEVEILVVDSDWQTVWGPYKPAGLQWLPRVEPAGSEDFLVFAVANVTSPDQGAGSDNDLGSPFGPDPDLNVYAVDTSATPSGSASTLNGLWPVSTYALGRDGDSLDVYYKMYDTSPGPSGTVFVALPKDNTGKDLQVWKLDSTGSAVAGADSFTITDSSNWHLACYYHADTDTFLLYYEGEGNIYYSDNALTSLTTQTISAPSLVGIDTAISDLVGYRIGRRPWSPEFYETSASPNTSLMLNDVFLSLTGSSPATPAVGATLGERLPLLFNPVLVGGRVQYAYGGDKGPYGTSLTEEHYPYGSSVELYHLEIHDGPVTRPTVDLALVESRLGDHNHRFYAYGSQLDFDDGAGTTRPFCERPLVTGQMRVVGDSIYVPMSFLQSLQKLRNSLYNGVTVDFNQVENTNLRNRRVLMDITDGAGFYNDEQVVGVVEVKLPQVSSTSLDLGGTRIIPSGMVSAWAQDRVQPVALRAPAISAYDSSVFETIPVTRQVSLAAVGVVPATPGGAPDPAIHHWWDTPFDVKAVLVFTDASGVEYRSPPSSAVTVSGIGEDPDGFPALCPVVSLELHPQAAGFLSKEGALDVELYVTTRTDDLPASTADIDSSTYTMVCRMPVMKDSTGFFAVDTLQDYNRTGTTAPSGGDTRWNSPPHTNPLYTVTNELVPDHPPASNTMAQAGDYVFLLPSEDPYELWPSKPLVRGRVPEFNSLLTIQLPPDSGGGVSLAGTYDRLYAICKKGVWELPVLGGPDALGAGSFPPFRRVYVGEGAVSHAGTVETPSGVFYVTRTGPRLLGDGADRDIGRAVESALDWSLVTSATYVPEDDEIIWTSETEGFVSLSLRDGVWTTCTLNSLAGGLLGREFFRVRDDGTMCLQDTTLTHDVSDTRPVLGKYKSSWLKLGDVLGYKRFRRLGVLHRLATTPTAGKLSINLAYNYDPTIIDTFTWTASELNALDTPGHLVVRPSRQKADAVQVTIQETTEQVNVGQEVADISDLDWSLVALELRVGQKLGLLKIAEDGKK